MAMLQVSLECFFLAALTYLPVAGRDASQDAVVLEEVRSFWRREKSLPGFPRCDFKKVDGSKLGRDRFLESDLRGQPLLIDGVLPGKAGGADYFREPLHRSLSEFLHDYADQRVIFQSGPYQLSSPRLHSTVKEYFDLQDAGGRQVLFQRQMNLYNGDWKSKMLNEIWQRNELALPPFLADFNLQRLLSIGGLASVNNFHNEHDETWMLLIAGAKAWWIAPASVAHGKDIIGNQVNEWAVDPCTLLRSPEKAPKLPADVKFCLQLPGQIVHFGDRAVHATCNLEDFNLGMGSQGYTGNWPPLARAVHSADLVTARSLLETVSAKRLNKPIGVGKFGRQSVVERAIEVGNSSLVMELLRSRASLSSGKKADFRPIFLAASTGHLELMEMLIDHRANVADELEKSRKEGKHAIHEVASRGGYSSILDLLVTLRSDVSAQNGGSGAQALHIAASHGEFALMEKLVVSYGANANAVDAKRAQPVHHAAHEGHIGAIQLLLSYRASLAARAETGIQPLHIAARDNRSSFTESLLRLDADIAATDDGGQQALHFAVQEGHASVLELLLHHRADMAASDRQGQQALHAAVWSRHNQIARMLVERRCELSARERSRGMQSMHLAAIQNNVPGISLLARHRADIEAIDQFRSKPVHHASASGHGAVITALAKKRAALAEADHQGMQPLHLAVAIGHASVVEALIRHGVGYTDLDREGQRPYDVAMRRGHASVAQVLSEALSSKDARAGKKKTADEKKPKAQAKKKEL